MTSPFLEKPLRPRHVVVAELIANMRETYLLVDLIRGEPWIRDADLGQTFDAVVRDLLAGEYDHRTEGKMGIWDAPVAVLRISRDAPAEDVTEKIADAMLHYLVNNRDASHDEEGYLCARPFLDNVRPNWEDALPVGKVDPPEYEHEERLEREERKWG